MFAMAKSSSNNGIIKVDTDKVRTVVTDVDKINNNLEKSFESVINSVRNLDASWDSSASSKAITKFNKIKSDFCGPSGRKAVVQNYLKFLSNSVAIGYETTEGTNTKLSELFK